MYLIKNLITFKDTENRYRLSEVGLKLPSGNIDNFDLFGEQFLGVYLGLIGDNNIRGFKYEKNHQDKIYTLDIISSSFIFKSKHVEAILVAGIFVHDFSKNPFLTIFMGFNDLKKRSIIDFSINKFWEHEYILPLVNPSFYDNLVILDENDNQFEFLVNGKEKSLLPLANRVKTDLEKICLGI
jgi:hypothetical protein